MEKMSTSINKVNELIKSTNFNTNKLDTNIITNALEECQNYVQNMSKGLNLEINNNKNNYTLNKNNNNNINDILKKNLLKESIIDIKNLKDKKKKKKIFKQYFINLAKFSKTMVDYGINDDDSK